MADIDDYTLKLPFLREVLLDISNSSVTLGQTEVCSMHTILFATLIVRLQDKYWLYTNNDQLTEINSNTILTFCDDNHKRSVCFNYLDCIKYLKNVADENIDPTSKVMLIKLAEACAPIYGAILCLAPHDDNSDNIIKNDDFILNALQSVIFEHKLLKQAKQIGELNGSLQLREDMLKESNKTNVLYTMVSHEFKTPIHSILSSAELLGIKLDRMNPTLFAEQYKPLCDIISSNAYRTLRLASNLLDAAALDDHKMQLFLSYGDIVDTVKNITNSMEPIALSYNIALKCSSALNSINLMHDKEKIERILLNLISNAIKSTATKRETQGSIEISISENLGFVIIAVKDNGDGICEADFDKIFNKFYTKAKSLSGQSAGTGLGLAVAKQLATLMTGDITVSNNPTGGCTFALYLSKVQRETLDSSILRSSVSDYQNEILNEWAKMEYCDLAAFIHLE